MLYRRYIFLQVLCCSTLSIVLFVAILLAANAVKDILGIVLAGQMPVSLFFKAIFTLIPSAVSYALPMGMVSGVLIVIGRMSSNNEILALQLGGTSCFRISVPILWLAFMGTCVAFFVNFFYAPHAIYRYRQNFKMLIQMDPMRFIRPHCFIQDFRGYVIFAETQKNDSFHGLYIWELDQNAHLIGFMYANSGKIFREPEKDTMRLNLNNGFFERHKGGDHGPTQTVHFKDLSINLSPRMLHKNGGIDDQKRLKYCDIFELIHIARHEIPRNQNEIDVNQRKRDRIIVNYVIQQNLAMAVSIFSLTFVSIPLAIGMRRREVSANAMCAVFLSFFYYMSTIFISWCQNILWLRVDLLIWCPNVILLLTGMALFHRQNHLKLG